MFQFSKEFNGRRRARLEPSSDTTTIVPGPSSVSPFPQQPGPFPRPLPIRPSTLSLHLTHNPDPSPIPHSPLNPDPSAVSPFPPQPCPFRTQGFVNGPHALEAEAAEDKISAPVFPLCQTEGPDFIPCLENEAAIKALKSTSHYEHRERHCPGKDGVLRCLLPLPEGYKAHVNWPESRDQIWFANVPHTQLANYKADQNWIKPEGDRFIFPGGGTQFKYGVTKYITWLQEVFPFLSFGKRIRAMLDMGCGVASFGAYLDAFHTRVLSVAPRDEHEAQVQFALERGVPALVGVMGTQRQPLPSNVLDALHCARCRVPWHAEGGKLLLEVNRLLRPGGYFIWSATPVCKECAAKGTDDEGIWAAMTNLTASMCWKRVGKKISHGFGIGVAVWQKPTSNDCYAARPAGDLPPMCPLQDNADAAWYIPMQACLHPVPSGKEERGGAWPAEGEERLTAVPGWLGRGKGRKIREEAGGEESGRVRGEEGGEERGGEVVGVYGRPVVKEYQHDVGHWERVVRHYVDGLGINWEGVRNVLDMDAHYGGGEVVGVYGRPVVKEYQHDVGHWERVVRHYVDGLGINWEGVRNVLDMDAHYGGDLLLPHLGERGEVVGVYRRPVVKEYQHDVGDWERVVRHYVDGLGIRWEGVRNVLDMDARYGGFGAALEKAKPVWVMSVVPTTSPDTLPVVFDRGLLGVYHDCFGAALEKAKPVWVMSVVPTTSPDTLPVVFDRGLLGVYHDWCEAFNTYPRTYDLVHSDHHFGKALTEKRCEAADIVVEIDRILRPFGYLIAREHAQHIPFLQAVVKGLGWSQTVLVKEGREAFVVFQKTMWRPEGQAEQQQ
ncbi:unnamed protein product [Closterium sp. NIES-65]|nr:unnamed protein product [Closterium sp. NIES-65]